MRWNNFDMPLSTVPLHRQYLPNFCIRYKTGSYPYYLLNYSITSYPIYHTILYMSFVYAGRDKGTKYSCNQDTPVKEPPPICPETLSCEGL